MYKSINQYKGNFLLNERMNEEKEMRVKKRNGTLEDISFDKILTRIKILGEGPVENQCNSLNINYSSLTMKVIQQLYDMIPTKKIDELAAEQCASLSTHHPDYGILAGRIIVSNHQKNVNMSFKETMCELYMYKDKTGLHCPLISRECWEIVSGNSDDYWNELMDHSRDYLIDYFGFKTLERSYLFRIDDQVVESIQHMWLRVSIGIHSDDLVSVKDTCDSDIVQCGYNSSSLEFMLFGFDERR